MKRKSTDGANRNKNAIRDDMKDIILWDWTWHHLFGAHLELFCPNQHPELISKDVDTLF